MKNDENKPTLISILKDSNYNLSLFGEKDIRALESKIKIQKNKPHIECIIREKDVQLKPEEVVRQLYTAKLINQYGYPKKRIRYAFTEQGVAMLSSNLSCPGFSYLRASRRLVSL